jgi:hypothetical protein
VKFLFDTNVVIPAEPASPDDVEPKSPMVVELLGALAGAGHQAYLHPESVRELEGDRNEARRELLRLLVKKYPLLPSPPAVPAAVVAVGGDAAPGTHDATDQALLAAVHADAVDYLVTDDRDLLRLAHRLGLTGRLLSIVDALVVVRGLFPISIPPPPAVREILAHELDERDPIFDSFRRDYPNFDAWLRRCKREHRRAWAIGDNPLAGVSIVKDESTSEYGLRGRLLKICSFKIADPARGYRYGELLLKSILAFAFGNQYERAYVTVYPKYADLIALLEAFGFRGLTVQSSLGENVLMKELRFTREDYERTPALEFHIRYGPRYLKVDGVSMFVVPILPMYHRLLFPEAQRQLGLLVGQHPFGNSIRKAYLCHAATRQIAPGSVLLFYRSDDERAVGCVGVAEETLISDDPATVARFVGQRTVYGYDEIVVMCQRPVLAILFRHARTLDVPLGLGVLEANHVLRAAPRSITSVREEGLAWLRQRLVLWP